MLPRPRLAEEGVEGVVSPADGLVGGHLSVGLDAVLQAVQLPAGIAHLGTGLADVHGDTLALWRGKRCVTGLLQARVTGSNSPVDEGV